MTANILVTSPYRPFTLPDKFSAVFNGYVYCGLVDKDPLIPVNQVQIYLVNENGAQVPVSQPLRTSAGGFLVYNGKPAKFVTDSNHSLLVLGSDKSHIWYEPDVASINPDSLRELLLGSGGAENVGVSQGGSVQDYISGKKDLIYRDTTYKSNADLNIPIMAFASKVSGNDWSEAIIAAVELATSSGGGNVIIHKSPTPFDVSKEILVQASGVKIIGLGSGGNHDTQPTVNISSRIRWVGPAGGKMITFKPKEGSHGRLSENGFSGVYLDSNTGRASIGLSIVSTCNGTFEAIGNEFTESLCVTGCTEYSIGESRDPQFNSISIDHRNLTNYGSSYIADGVPGANTSMNYFPYIHTVVNGKGVSVELSDADNNTFERINIYSTKEGSEPSLRFKSGPSDSRRARGNLVKYFTSNVAAFADSSQAYPSINNTIEYIDSDNGTPDPVIGTGATLFFGRQSAPIGFRERIIDTNNGEYSVDSGGKITICFKTGQIQSGTSASFNYPYNKKLPSGVLSCSVTPLGASPTSFSAEAGSDSIKITNGVGVNSSFYVSITGL